MRRQCGNCGVGQAKQKIISLLTPDVLPQLVTYHCWEHVQEGTFKKMMKVRHRCTVSDILDLLFKELDGLAIHKFNDKWQRRQFYCLKDNLPLASSLMVIDFAENYTCKNQDEAQSAYWGYSAVTVHPTVVYRKCQCGELVTDNLVFFTSDLKHDAHVVNCFFLKTIDHLKATGLCEKVFIFSDGCSEQYKSKLPFFYLSCAPVPTEKMFFGARHGKNACDALGGTVKNLCMNLVASDTEVIISNAEDMYNICKEKFSQSVTGACGSIHKRREFFIVRPHEIDRTLSSDSLRTVPGTRSLHQVKALYQNSISARKLACFCHFCISQEGTGCDNYAHVDAWQVFKMSSQTSTDSHCPSPAIQQLEPMATSTHCPEIQISEPTAAPCPPVESATPSHDARNLKVGSFYIVMWHGKDYVAQLMKIDEEERLAELNFMKWSNGMLQWADTDHSWEDIDFIGAEVQLKLAEKFSNSRIQRYFYSYIM